MNRGFRDHCGSGGEGTRHCRQKDISFVRFLRCYYLGLQGQAEWRYTDTQQSTAPA